MRAFRAQLSAASSLKKNVAALSIVQAANYLVPLITVPYLVRMLGVKRYGEIAFAQAFVQYFLILTDYGFNYSGTRSISIARHDPERIGHLYRSITLAKVVLLVAGSLAMAILIVAVPRFDSERALLAVSFIAVVGNILFPVWLFQGLEKMGRIAVLSLLARTSMLCGMFLLVRGPADYLLAAALQAGGTCVAGVCSIPVVLRQFPRVSRWPSTSEIKEALVDGWPLFVSTAAITLYTSSNIFILGLVEGPTMVAYYAVADKVVKAVLGLSQPITQALYPRMVHLFDNDLMSALRYLRQLAVPMTIFALLLSAATFGGAKFAIDVIFGSKMEPAATLIKIMAAIPVLAVWSNILGVQLLFPLGYQALASRFLVIAGIASIIVLVPMVDFWGMRGSAFNYIGSELAVTFGFFLIARSVLRSRAISNAKYS